MFIFVVVLGLISAVISSLLQFELILINVSYRQKFFHLFAWIGTATIVFFALVSESLSPWITAFLGIVFILTGFYYLGILPQHFINENKFLTIPFIVHLFLISVVAALSGLAWQPAFIGILLFLVLFFVFYYFLYRFRNGQVKSNINVKEILEFVRVVNGIFIFILGMIIAMDRIRFLEKFANWLFN